MDDIKAKEAYGLILRLETLGIDPYVIAALRGGVYIQNLAHHIAEKEKKERGSNT